MKTKNKISLQSGLKEIGLVEADDNVLVAYSHQPDGLAAGERYMASQFDAKAGAFVSAQEQLELHLQKRLEDEAENVTLAEREFRAYIEAPGILELNKPDMPLGIRRIQRLRLSGIIFLTMLGTASFASLLSSSSEALADNYLKSLGIALTATATIGIGVKCLLGLINGHRAQAISALTTTVFGLSCAIGALVGNSIKFGPMTPEDEAKMIKDTLSVDLEATSDDEGVFDENWGETQDGSTTIAPEEPDPCFGFDIGDEVSGSVATDLSALNAPLVTETWSFWDRNVGSKVMVMTVLAEACLVASLGFFWKKTRDGYRDSALHRQPEYRKRKKTVRQARKVYNKIFKKLLPVRGRLETISAERNCFIELGRARLKALKG